MKKKERGKKEKKVKENPTKFTHEVEEENEMSGAH